MASYQFLALIYCESVRPPMPRTTGGIDKLSKVYTVKLWGFTCGGLV